MDFTPDTPRGNHIVHGQTVTVPYVFAEGDTLSADGALYLNKAVAGNLTNVLGTAARKWAEAENAARKDKKHAHHGIEATPADFDLQAELDKRFAVYTLSGSAVRTSTPSDPTDKFAHAIAGEKVKELYKAKGFKFRDMRAAGSYDKHVAQYLERNPWVMELAKSQVAAMKSAADGFDLSE